MKQGLQKLGSTLYRWWMQFARALAFVNTRIILTLVYVLLLAPVALLLRLMGKDYLDRRLGGEESYWKAKESVDPTLEQSKRQF